MAEAKDWEDKMLADSRTRWEKQKFYLDLAEDLGDSISFDGSKATVYIRPEYPIKKEKQDESKE